MYKFIFYCEDGGKYEFENIERVAYKSPNGIIQLNGNQILSHSFWLGYDYYLFSKTSTFTISGKNLRCIEATET